MFSHLHAPSYALLCLSGVAKTSPGLSQKKINQEVKLTILTYRLPMPSQRQPRSANSQPTSRILIKPSFDQQKHLTNPQLTPKVQAINAYCSMLKRFCRGLLLSIIVVIDHTCRGIFSFDMEREKVRGFLTEKIKTLSYFERFVCI